MEGEKKKSSCFGTSWADEVEREEEEEEEARKQWIEFEAETNKIKKINPFGAARPRELVLQEKGVDWRKLDQDLEHKHSNLRKDKKLKENNISLTPPIIRHDHFPLRSVCPEQKKPHPQTTSPFVPPLRYAPKNIMAVMEQIRRGHKDFSDAARENSCRGKTRANHIKNTENVPVFSLREEHSGSQCQRKYFDERSFVAHQQMHSNERGQVLVDPNMERANIGMRYGNCRTERRMSFAYGDQKLEISHSVRHYKDYSGDANRGGRSIGKGLKSAECHGDREKTNHCAEGVDLRDGIRMKRRLSAIQHGPCHQKRQGKQSRKLDFK